MTAHHGLTAVEGLLVGHNTLSGRPTGCTVVLAPEGAVAAVDVRGGAPGTRETDLLDPSTLVQQVHAVVLAGGSAFGLDAAGGVMRYLEERGIGYDVGVAKVPIVPAAILFDLTVGDAAIRPTAESGYEAARSASAGPVAEGNVGAGAGATVGKLAGPARAMKSGLGSASIRREDGLVVAALAAVNAMGDVLDPDSGRILAGLRTEDGVRLADTRNVLCAGTLPGPLRHGQNTVLAVVATNARLTQAEARKVAQMAQDGLARAVVPSHTPFDGDTIFALATGKHAEPVEVLLAGTLAAEVLTEAIVRAVKLAEGLPGLPAAKDLAGGL